MTEELDKLKLPWVFKDGELLVTSEGTKYMIDDKVPYDKAMEFIVRAANSHHALVASLEEMKRHRRITDGLDGAYDSDMVRARAALKKAKGSE